ncbi:hypothetical protein H9Q70_014718, partial [Fusarium xylarioides]
MKSVVRCVVVEKEKPVIFSQEDTESHADSRNERQNSVVRCVVVEKEKLVTFSREDTEGHTNGDEGR